jgi:hypothetical protein
VRPVRNLDYERRPWIGQAAEEGPGGGAGSAVRGCRSAVITDGGAAASPVGGQCSAPS